MRKIIMIIGDRHLGTDTIFRLKKAFNVKWVSVPKCLSPIVFAMTLMFITPLIHADINTGLISHWTFDEGSGTTATDTCKIDNPTCTPSNGVLTNGPTWTVGKFGGAVSLDGVDDRITTIFNTKTKLEGHDFTIAFWAKPDGVTAGKYFYSSASSGASRFYLGVQDPSFNGRIILGLSSWNPMIGSAVTGDQWQHYAIVVQGTTGYFYRNSTLMGTQTGIVFSLPNQNLMIGQGHPTGGNFKGSLDDFRVYNQALSKDEIFALTGFMDTESPSVPSSVAASPISENVIDIKWNASTDNIGVLGYKVYRDSGSGFVLIADQAATVLRDTGLDKMIAYNYKIKAYDGAGNESAFSNTTLARPEPSVCVGTPGFRTCTVVRILGDENDFISAIRQAQDGDTVVVPEGTWTFNKYVSIDAKTNPRSLVIKAVNPRMTTILDNVPVVNTAAPVFYISTIEGKTFRLSGFNIQTASGNIASSYSGKINIGGTSKAIRIDNNYFNITTGDRAIYTTGHLYGVIDHNTFEGNGQAVTIHHSSWGGKTWGDGSWAAPLTLGTREAIYIEDNLFKNRVVTDGFDGARFVVRYNQIETTGIPVQNHGTESTGRGRSTYSMEVYNNVVKLASATSFLHSRGGTAVVFDNTVKGSDYITSLGSLNNYRNYHDYFPYGSCGSGSPFDLMLKDKAGSDVVFQSGTHTDPLFQEKTGGRPAIVTDASKIWRVNQWVGHTLTNKTKNWASQIISNTANTITVSISPHATSTGTPGGHNWDTGDSYEIKQAIACIDQIGRSTGDLISGPEAAPIPLAWPKQSLQPVYSWGNTFNGKANNSIGSTAYVAKLDREFIQDKVRPGYTTYVYPHPLVSGGAYEEPPANAAPVVVANATVDGVDPMTVHFDATGSSDDHAVISYEWDFGDGTRGVGLTASHKYLVEGVYTVNGIVSDSNASIGSRTINVDVKSMGKIKLGDISNDGKITMYDTALVFRYTLGSLLTAEQKDRADINVDGKIDGADVMAIARKALGL